MPCNNEGANSIMREEPQRRGQQFLNTLPSKRTVGLLLFCFRSTARPATTFASGGWVPSRAGCFQSQETARAESATSRVYRRWTPSQNTYSAFFAAVLATERVDSSDDDYDVERPRNVRFVAPLLEYGYRPAVEEFENQTLLDKPLLLYLPGFDGTFLSPFLQFPELHTLFDIRCLTVQMDDRSTLDELRDDVIAFLERECCTVAAFTGNNTTPTLRLENESVRPVYLAGESFGGILASVVALSLLQGSSSVDLKGLTLINAATCYDRSRLAMEGPKVAKLHKCVYPVGLLTLLTLFTDNFSGEQLLLILRSKALPSVIDDACREAYMGRVAFSLPFVIPFMTQATLQWRLTEWLEAGCARLSSAADLVLLKGLRTLVVVGENDATLPSIAEAERLASLWKKNAVVHVVGGAGHASTCGSRVDLAALFRSRFAELRSAPPPAPKGFPALNFWQRESSPRSKLQPSARTAMKEVAANGTGAYFGMEPRYDNASFGLNPLKYWSSDFYLRWSHDAH